MSKTKTATSPPCEGESVGTRVRKTDTQMNRVRETDTQMNRVRETDTQTDTVRERHTD